MRLYVLRRREPTGGFTFRFFWAYSGEGALAIWAAEVEGDPPTHYAVFFVPEGERESDGGEASIPVLKAKSFVPLG